MRKEKPRTVIISDVWGYGLMETKPHPLWQVRYAAIRNKALLVPEYGAMYIAAFLKKHGWEAEVLNLVADVFREESWFREREEGLPDDATSTAPVGGEEALALVRKNMEDALRDLQPQVVLFPLSIYYLALHAREMLRRLREMLPEAVLVTGGIYATMHPREVMEDGAADFVVRGEGEWTTLELLEALREGERDFSGIDGLTWRGEGGRIIHNPDREREDDLDRFPHIYTVSREFRIAERHRLLKSLNPFDDYIPGAGFLTSRGCPERCTFCLDPAVWKRRTRFHSPAYVREVLDYCWENFTGGDRSFYFGDATFALNRNRLWKLLETVREVPFAYHIQTRADSLTPEVLNGLRESNFRTVALGAESFDDRILSEVVKKRTTRDEILSAVRAARRHGLQPILTFIAGLPGETRRSMERTVEILRREGIREATFFPLVVFRGTALYERFLRTYGEEERESMRLNPWSEEFCFASEEFPTMQELISYAESLNKAIRA
ncbi:radical SAM protein [Candidatus Solincola tengchongensis]|uniref:B12-binding domain-containing radical SAM protein n=1 Tax=Candidatus Solincola tengchongensis TaxID=2900693 RepID=UPI00257A3BBA|nr:radical SAM protein [Candidatus Solincola tengchongensis]